MADTVLITGCSSGFGRAAVGEFRAAGWNVVATMRDTARWVGEPADETLLILPLDVTDEASVATAFASATSRFGALSCVVNNAGRGLLSVFEATPDETVREIFDTNTFGPMAVARAAIPHMRRAGGGSIVNVASGAAIAPDPLMSVYAASKAALDGFCEALSHELEPLGVAVKIILPGFVAGTNFTARTQETAQAIPMPAEYEGYVHQRIASYQGADTTALARDEDVAAAMVAAAVDRTGRLRWLVGPDAAELAYHRWETSEASYAEWIKRRFEA